MWEIRTITPDDADLFRQRLYRGFGGDPEDDERAAERFDATHEYDRTLAVFDGDDIVGTGGAFSLGLTVPGGANVPMGGTTIISVQPTHRRRGILRQLMDRHLDDVAEREEPLAGLWASETSIYGRFGYGPSSYRHKTDIDASKLVFRGEASADGGVRLIDPDEAADILPRVYETARLQRPGMLTRSAQWWQHRVLADVESRRGGKSAHRYVAYEANGETSGYAIYRQKRRWEDFVADGEVGVQEVIALDSEARRGIWRFLTSIDLFPRVSWWNAPIDDPLPMMVTESRRIRRTVSDALWIRPMDLPAALEARSYADDGVVSIEVVDRFRNIGGVYRIEVSEGRARCLKRDGTPDVTVDLDVIGHLYLGGGDARQMAAAGRIWGDPGAVATLDRLFRWDVAPWCPEVF